MATKKVKSQIISREAIKPSSPTLPHLRSLKLSLLDQLAMRIYIPIMLFYESDNIIDSNIDIFSRRLKKSLSGILTLYYPFAGRLADDGLTIDCGDQGVCFVEARVLGCQLHDFLQKPDAETQNLLFPEGFLWKDQSCGDSSLLGIQLSFFDCGGATICVSISHKIADGSTISTFLQDWAAATACDGTGLAAALRPRPNFIANSVLPVNLASTQLEIVLDQKRKACVTKRFVLDGLKIATLRKSMHFPTKVEIVTSLLYKCAINATSNSQNYAESLLIQLVNMRGRVFPPLPENSIGNFTWYYTLSPAANKEIRGTEHDHEMKASMNELAAQLKNGKLQLCKGNRNADDWLLEVFESTKEVKMLFDDLDVYRCSSFVNRPFYQLDFGWGKPKWVSMADQVVKNVFVLFDTPDGDGVEALVTLEEEEMIVFEKNIAFALRN